MLLACFPAGTNPHVPVHLSWWWGGLWWAIPETTLTVNIVKEHLDWLWTYCPRAQRRGQTCCVNSWRTYNIWCWFHLPRNAGSRPNAIFSHEPQATSRFHSKPWSLWRVFIQPVWKGGRWGHNWLWWFFFLRDGEALPLEFWISVVCPYPPFFIDFSLCSNGKFAYCYKTVIGRNYGRVCSSYLSYHRHSPMESRWL